MQAKQITVHGRVQGVGFRYFVQHVARKLGLVGNVRNCPDLTVEILVEGDAAEIGKLVEQVKQGPPLSGVQRVDVVDIPVKGSYSSFLIEGW
ncbi:MAG: acylphosphatase [Acidobacteriota bacterium]|jgi:acylphosphatase